MVSKFFTNRYLKIWGTLFAIVLLSEIKIFAQDPIFTQFYSNPVYLNPAFTGSNKCPRIVSNYRNQWPSFLSLIHI